jgi:hypothetical protein
MPLSPHPSYSHVPLNWTQNERAYYDLKWTLDKYKTTKMWQTEKKNSNSNRILVRFLDKLKSNSSIYIHHSTLLLTSSWMFVIRLQCKNTDSICWSFYSLFINQSTSSSFWSVVTVNSLALKNRSRCQSQRSCEFISQMERIYHSKLHQIPQSKSSLLISVPRYALKLFLNSRFLVMEKEYKQ